MKLVGFVVFSLLILGLVGATFNWFFLFSPANYDMSYNVNATDCGGRDMCDDEKVNSTVVREQNDVKDYDKIKRDDPETKIGIEK